MTETATDGRLGYAFGPFRLLVGERLLKKEGAEIPLGSRAFDLLTALAEKAGQVVGKRELISYAWPDLTVDESSLRFHIAVLRKTLGDGRNGARFIANVPGRGYCLVSPATPIKPDGERSSPPPDRPRPPNRLPRRLDRMIGRDQIVRHICEQIAEYRFVTIHGPGGIGKTTVAVAACHDMLEAYVGAVHFLDLAPHNETSLIGSALASVLDIGGQSDDPVSEIIAYLRPRRALILFDCCEHVVEELAALTERIFHEAPQVGILVTSRERLRVEGEHVLSLPSLEQPADGTALTADRMRDFAALQLFVERATSVGQAAQFSDADAAIIADICRKLDGIALAIELVASRAAQHGLRETAALIDSRLRLVWRGKRTAPPRHQTLKATIDWSYALVSEAERTVLRRLSVFAGPFDLSEAQIVVADAHMDRTEVAQALEDLVAKSLVFVFEIAKSTQYRLLDTTREYGWSKLAEAGEKETLSKRHAEHVLNKLRETGAPTPAGSHMIARETAGTLLADVNLALGWSFSEAGNAGFAVELAAAAAPLFIEMSLLSQCRRWCERALATLGDGLRNTPVEMELNAALGHAQMFTGGNADTTLGALDYALAAARRFNDPQSQFQLLSRLHMYRRRTAEISELVPIAREAETLAVHMGNPVAIAAAHNLLGVSFHLVGDQAQARAHLEVALHMGEFRHVAPGHFAFHRNPHIALSRCLWLQGYADEALSTAEPLATEAVATDVVTYCISLIWGAAVYHWTGEWKRFEDLTQRLRAHSENNSLRPYQAVAMGMQGEFLIRAGQVDAGIALLRSAVMILRQSRYQLYLPQFYITLAVGLVDLGKTGEAKVIVDEALTSMLADGECLMLPELLRVRGEIALHVGEQERARQSFAEAISLAEKQGALSWRLRSEISLARLVSQQEGARAARTPLERVYAHFTEGFGTTDLMAARGLLCELDASLE